MGLLLGVIGVSTGNGSGMTGIQIVAGSIVGRRWKLVVMHCWAAASESIEARYERRVVFEAVISKFKVLFWSDEGTGHSLSEWCVPSSIKQNHDNSLFLRFTQLYRPVVNFSRMSPKLFRTYPHREEDQGIDFTPLFLWLVLFKLFCNQ